MTTILPAADPDALAAAAAALEAGGIVGLPTETVYGIGVLPRPDALEALIRAKRRPLDKGIALLIDGLDQVEGLVELPDAAAALSTAFWPGPLTLVLPLRDDVSLPDAVTGGRPALGIRVPDHPTPRALARRVGPLAVSSANVSGEPAAATVPELVATVGGSLALALDDGPVRGGVASTVVIVSAGGETSIARLGALAEADIEAALAG